MAGTTSGKRTAGRPPRKRAAGEAANLSPQIIVDAALKSIDRDGLESFSLRNLAADLGVYPTAIYWYVPNRNELMARVVARILEGVAQKRRRNAWQDHLRDLFRNFREVLSAHPNIAPLVGTQIVSNTSMGLRFVEDLLGTLSQAGLSGAALVGAYNTVVAALVGFIAQEFAPLPTEDTALWQKQVRERLGSINHAEYPLLSSNLALLSNHAFILRWENGVDAPLDDSFDVFVDVVIAGIERLAERATSKGTAAKRTTKAR